MMLPGLTLRAGWLRSADLQMLFDAIEKAGGEARVAGGAVRDALMRRPVQEVDLATTLTPDQVMAAARKAKFKTVPTGIEHGTVTVLVEDSRFEVTTLRRDVETDGRRATVAFGTDWREDALRRDFTMNALMCDRNGKIYDFTAGYRDIQRKRIIFVGAPRERIREDYLRILRYYRFLALFGMDWVHRASLDACAMLRGGLKSLSAERITSEMLKLLAAPHAVPVLKLMAKRAVLKQIVPHTEQWALLARLPPDPLLRLFVLAEKPATLQEAWRLSNAQGKRLEALGNAPPVSPALRPAEQRAMLYRLGAEGWRDAVHLAQARAKNEPGAAAWKRLLKLPDRWQVPAMPVNGGDLITAGMKPGPAMGRVLRRLEDHWIATDFKAGKNDLLRQLGDAYD
jgi:poly(A) polymerase